MALVVIDRGAWKMVLSIALAHIPPLLQRVALDVLISPALLRTPAQAPYCQPPAKSQFETM